MASDIDRLRDVLDAATALLAAREDEMLTADEWDALEHAVAACSAVFEDAMIEWHALREGAPGA